jgi:FkbM family methyltransferase
MIIKENFLQRKLRDLALKVFHRLENNGDPNFEINGERVFVDNLFKQFKQYQQSEVVLFDVGANVGAYSQMFLDKGIQSNLQIYLHVFEPMQSCFEILQKKFFGLDWVTLNKLATSNQEGQGEIFYDTPGSSLASLHHRNSDWVNLNKSERVETIRLDTYIQKFGHAVTHIDFLKMDVEGHELYALQGLGSYLNGEFIDFIQFEYGGATLDAHCSLMELYEILTKAGFKVAKVMPMGIEIRPYQPFMENFQYSNYVAISEFMVSRLN